MSDYEETAQKFLERTGVSFKAEFLKNDKYFPDDEDFPDDEEKRDIYNITLSRDSRLWTFTFGQSIQASGKFILNRTGDKVMKIPYRDGVPESRKANKDYVEPSTYDVLAAITKNDPGTFQQFCDDFGYSSDSIKNRNTYDAVCKEWLNVQILWNDKEIEELQEIN